MTKPGPPPVPTVLRMMRGNPSRRPLRSAPQPLVPEKVPEPPDFLTGYGLDEYWRVGPELHRLGLLTVLDVMPLAAYATAYGLWRRAEEALARTVDPAARRVLERIARDSCAAMVKFGCEFGITPSARSRVSAGVPADASNKFTGLLAGGPRDDDAS